MAKLTKHEHDAFKINLEYAKELLGLTVISYRDEGITIAAQYTSLMKTHFKLAITHCSNNDKFNRKRGLNSVMEKFWNGSYIVMPAHNDKIENEIGEFMENNFGWNMHETKNNRKVMC